MRERVEEKEIKEERREPGSGHCQTSISSPFQVNPRIVYWSFANGGVEEMNMELAAQPARPDWLTICIC